MSQKFKAAMAFVRAWEGGWSNDRLDPGGLTKWGVTIRTIIAKALDFNRDGKVNEADLAAMTEAQAEALYRSDYYDALRCDDLPAPLALIVFDCAVNQGPSRAARFLQQAAGAAVDGKVGPDTITRANVRFTTDAAGLIREFQARRAVHYSALPTIARFGLGWFRRLMDGTIQAAQIVAEDAPPVVTISLDAKAAVAAARKAIAEASEAIAKVSL